jgi:hypothetical protein
LLRARANRRECPHSDFIGIEPEAPAAEHREELREVVAAVRSLPERQREAIVMRELEGRSYDEIAIRLGTTNGGVRQLLHRARSSVRERVGAFTGLEPLIRWLVGSGNGVTVARVGALSGGCAVTLKVCTATLLPAILAGGITAAPSGGSRSSRHLASHSAARLGTRATASGTAAASPVTRSPAAATSPSAPIGSLSTTAPPRPFTASRPSAPATQFPAQPAAPEWGTPQPSAPQSHAPSPSPSSVAGDASMPASGNRFSRAGVMDGAPSTGSNTGSGSGGPSAAGASAGAGASTGARPGSGSPHS